MSPIPFPLHTPSFMTIIKCIHDKSDPFSHEQVILSSSCMCIFLPCLINQLTQFWISLSYLCTLSSTLSKSPSSVSININANDHSLHIHHPPFIQSFHPHLSQL